MAGSIDGFDTGRAGRTIRNRWDKQKSMRRYYYRLLQKYLSFYIRMGDRFLIIRSRSDVQRIKEVKPDYIILDHVIHYDRDIQGLLEEMHSCLAPGSRVIILHYSALWSPIFRLATRLHLREKSLELNWVTHEDIYNFLLLSGYEPIKRDGRILIPVYIPIVSNLVNRWLAPIPFLRLFAMLNILVARPVSETPIVNGKMSVSIIVPARNEAGNIRGILKRIPRMGPSDELIFVEGNSTDSTWETIQAVQQESGQKLQIKSVQQSGKGKGDAVRKGFSIASKDVLMILDADMTVPPEDLSRFFKALVTGKGEFINGSRLVYPMEKGAMRFLNVIGNKFFAAGFSFLLGQRFKDTLCGTKVLTRQNYLRLAAHRSYFGEFDPFGDFDLLFGASRLGLKIVELPVAYREREYGETNISRWRHGFTLLIMLLFASRKIKFI